MDGLVSARPCSADRLLDAALNVALNYIESTGNPDARVALRLVAETYDRVKALFSGDISMPKVAETASVQPSVSPVAIEVFTEKKPEPAVSLEHSITSDGEFIICLEDGQRCRMMARYLMRKFSMTPEQYRRKWSLPDSYPMNSPGYQAKQSRNARELGLGTTENKQGKGRVNHASVD